MQALDPGANEASGHQDSIPSQGQDPSPVPLPGGGPPADLAPAPAAAAASPPLLLDITADQQGFDLVINRYVATGNASALLSGGRLMAERIEYDTVNRTVYATGSVRFQRGNQFLQASKLRFNLIEGRGEMEDVYGVLDLTTSVVDLNPEVPPAEPLGAPPQLACPTELPPIPNWHPYPWAATAWAGQTTNAGFGETFVFQGPCARTTCWAQACSGACSRPGPSPSSSISTCWGTRRPPKTAPASPPRASEKSPLASVCGPGCSPGSAWALCRG